MLRTALFTLLLLSAAPDSSAQSGEEVPFITTPDNVTLALLQLAGVTRRDHVIDLGSGDGRIVITAAKRFGARGLGVEIVPDLVARSRASAERAGVAHKAQFLEQDLFKTDLAAATVITMYLLPEVNLQLRPALLALKPGTRIVSHDWDMGDWPPDQTLTVDAPEKNIGREKLSRLHRWVVPAQVQGLWCGSGQRSLSMRLEQKFQWIEGESQWVDGLKRVPLKGRLDGAVLRLWGEAGMYLTARVEGQQLRVLSSSAALGSARFHHRDAMPTQGEAHCVAQHP